MCRIFGQFGKRQINELLLQKSALSMIHGGPDQQNYLIGNGWAIGNDRLLIQGIDGRIQPFIGTKDISVVFNGEIYNHHELRKFLVSKGHIFQDNCDGNVIAPLFAIYGENFVKHLDAMFAIAIIDERHGADLHIYTDPAGISVFLRQDFVNRGYFNSDNIKTFLDLQARTPSADLANMLWSVMIFELWHRNVDDMNSSMEYNKAPYMHQVQLSLDP